MTNERPVTVDILGNRLKRAGIDKNDFAQLLAVLIVQKHDQKK